MARLVNLQTKQYEDVPDKDVDRAFASGKFGIEQAPVEAPDAPEQEDPEVGALLAKTAREENEREEKYGGLKGAAIAGGLGLARGASFGLSDFALRHLAPKLADEASAYREQNPVASGAGELGAVLLPMAGVGGKILGAGVHGVEALGEAATSGLEHLGGKIAGEGAEGLAAKILTHYAPKVIGAGVEGAAYGIGNEITEASLGDEELTAEKLLAGAGKGFGIAGGAMAAGLLGQAAVKKLMPAHLKESIMSAISDKAQKVGAEFDPTLNREKFLGFNSTDFNPEKGAKAQAAAERVSEKGIFGRGEVEINPATNTFEKLEGSGNSLPNRAGFADRVEKSVTKLNDHIDNVINATDEAVARGAVDGEKFGKIVESLTAEGRQQTLEKIAEMRSNGMSDQTAKRLEELVDELHIKAMDKQGSLAGLQDLKQGIYNQINFDKMMPKPEQIVLKDVARSIKETIEKGTELARTSGALPFETASVKDLNRTLGDLLTVQKPLKRAIGRADAYATAGGLRIRDLGLGVIGGQVGGAIAGPPGAAIGAMVGGIGNRIASSERGYLLRAELADSFKQAHLRSIAKASGKVSQDIQEALHEFMVSAGEHATEVGKKVGGRLADKAGDRLIEEHEGPSVAGLAVEGAHLIGHTLGTPFTVAGNDAEPEKGKDKQALFKARAKELSDLVANPQKATEQLAESNADWRDSAPKVNDAVIAKNAAALNFLYQKMPKNPLLGKSLTPNLSLWQPSDAELSKWARYVDATRNPLGVIAALRTGTVTSEQVESLKTVYPKLYSEVQQSITDRMADLKATLPYSKRLQLGILFGVPADETLQPDFLKTMKTLAPPAAPHQGAPHPSPHPVKNKTTQAALTQSQRIESLAH